MPRTRYVKIKIGDNEVVVKDYNNIPISIGYSLEDSENFEEKKSSESFDLQIPANLQNEYAANTFRNPGIEDLTTGEVFKSSQTALIEANGIPLVYGKAFLKYAEHDYLPRLYSYNILGDNADWIVDLADSTIYDFIQRINFSFTKQAIIDSWNYDGTDENLPYIFAPIRYRLPFGGYTVSGDVDLPDDDNVLPEYLKPCISKYFILKWAFQSLGYKIASNFMDSEYFRRQVMPWTFGNFLDSGGTKLDTHKFLAKSVEDVYTDSDRGSKVDQYIDLNVTNDSTLGAYDNNNDYTYNSSNYEMDWTYNPIDYGPLAAAFSAIIYYAVSISGDQSYAKVRADWFINGFLTQSDEIVNAQAGLIGTPRPSGQEEIFFKTGDYGVNLVVGDVIGLRVHLELYRDKIAINDVAHVTLNVLQFQLDYFRVNIGGNINFVNFTSFQDYKVMDLIKGVADEYDLSINTDSINKIVYMEPTHPYFIGNNPLALVDGYFKNDYVDWNGKEDLEKNWKLENFADINKEFTFKYKDDSNDGILKLIQDRNTNVLASSKYVFPDRFIIGKKTRENRFFSAVMHYSVSQWTALGQGSNSGITPQIVCIIPENVSNTSQSASGNTFIPKSCYYKGNVTGAGAWRFDGDVYQTYPYLFSVNYQNGGENDPILSYSDENINGQIGIGLLKRFYWQRLAIMSNGKRYNSAYFNLNNLDVSNILHREFISYKGQRYELIQISEYKPLLDESTQCLLYAWYPVTQKDYDRTYPSLSSLNTGALTNTLDIKYAQLKCLYSDIPT